MLSGPNSVTPNLGSAHLAAAGVLPAKAKETPAWGSSCDSVIGSHSNNWGQRQRPTRGPRRRPRGVRGVLASDTLVQSHLDSQSLHTTAADTGRAKWGTGFVGASPLSPPRPSSAQHWGSSHLWPKCHRGLPFCGASAVATSCVHSHHGKRGDPTPLQPALHPQNTRFQRTKLPR